MHPQTVSGAGDTRFKETTFDEASFSEATHGGKAPPQVIGWLPQPDAERWKGTETILLVEDQTFVREVTAEVLCAAGYGVLAAESAEQAMLLYERHSAAIDLLVTDFVLPGETGLQFAARLATVNRRLKVLFVTGYVEHLKTLEGQDCLPKPFSTSALLEKVRQILDRHELVPAV